MVCFAPVLQAQNSISECNGKLFDDWVSAPESNFLCQGYYVEQPIPPESRASAHLPKPPISLSANHGQFISEGDSTLSGEVHLSQGLRQLFADRATIHRDPAQQRPIDWIEAYGNLKLTEPGFRVDGTRGQLLLNKDIDIIKNAHYRLYDRHARGNADTITIYNRNEMLLENASYTTCNPFQNTWLLKARRVELNKKTGRGRAHHTRFYVLGLPVFYWPYVDFPIDDRRQTGWLFPTYGYSNRSGLELGAPFYWNIAPHYDATITPSIFAKRGVELKGLFRYLLPDNSNGEVEAAFLPQDRVYRNFQRDRKLNHPRKANNDPRVSALNTNANRSALRVKHHTDFNQNLSANLKYHNVHDDNYFMDFGSTLGIASTTQLLQEGELLYQDMHWNAQTRIQQYKTLHPFDGPVTTDVYRRVPQIAVQNTYPDLLHGFEWNTTGEFSHFTHKHDPLTGAAFTVGDRFHLRPGLTLPIVYPGWYIKPRLQWDFLGYSLSVGPSDRSALRSSPTRTIPIVDLESGLIFERPFSCQQEPYIQTLEPKAYYLYVPFRDQNAFPNFDTTYPGFDYNQLYWDNRFTGLDRLGDTHQLTLGLSSRFITEKTGSERLSLTAGQILYFKDRQVTSCNPRLNPLCAQEENPNRKRHRSAWVGLARLRLWEEWFASTNVEWDPYQKRADKTALGLQYHPDESSVLNLGYQFLRRNPVEINPRTNLRERIEQTDTSIAWPLTERWRALGRWHYDVHRHRSNEIAFGIEQQGCCTAVRILATRFLEPFDNSQPGNPRRYTQAIFLQVIFKGFAGVGNTKINNSLQKIPGYHWRNDGF
jgi:LPS-assembly protein